jgi:hypothetical protein
VTVAPKQVNIRLDEETLDALEAAAFAKRTSLPEVVRPHLEELAQRYRQEKSVRTALLSREEQEASDAGKLDSLDERRRAAGDNDV